MADKTIQLLRLEDSTGTIEVTDEAIDFLMQLPLDLKIAPVTTIGPSHSGKSTFLHHASKHSSIQPEPTKGAILHTELQDTSQAQVKVLLIECQGLPLPTCSLTSNRSSRSSLSQQRSPRSGATQKPQTDRLVQFAVLMSSLLVFNLQGPISDQLLEYLEPVARLQECLKGEYRMQAKMVCLLRDFVELGLENVAGFQETTVQQQLENTFRQCSALATKKKKVQESLRAVFSDREVQTLKKPEHMHQSDSFSVTETEQSFTLACQALLAQITGQIVKPKQLMGKSMNAQVFLSIATEFCQLLNEQRPPLPLELREVIQRAMSEEAERQQERAYSQLEEWIQSQPKTEMDAQMRDKFHLQVIKVKQQLRQALSETLSFPEVCQETEQFEERAAVLIKSHLDRNYNTQFWLSLDFLRKLLNQECALELKDKYTRLLSDYTSVGTECMHEVLAEALGYSHANKFVDFDALELPEVAQTLNSEEDSLEQNLPIRERIMQEVPSVLELVVREIEGSCARLEEQLRGLELQQQNAYMEQQALEDAKASQMSRVGQESQRIQALQQQKQDLLVQAETLSRQIVDSRNQLTDYEELQRVQQQKQHTDQAAQLEDIQGQIRKAQDALDFVRKQSNEVEVELQKEQSAFNLEAGKYESDIQVAAADIEVMEQRLQTSSAKSVMFKTTHDFLEKELPEKYIQPLKAVLEQSPRDLKKEAFDLSRQIGQLRVQAQDKESTQKKQCQDFIANLKRQNQNLLQQQQRQLQDYQKQVQSKLQDKITVEKQMTDQMMEYVAQKENNFGLVEQLDEQEGLCQKSLEQIVALRSDLTQRTEQLMNLEEKSYEMTINNQAKLQLREKLIEILPEVLHQASQTKRKPSMVQYMLGQTVQPVQSESLRQALQKIDDDQVRLKVQAILKRNKLV